MKSIFDSYGSSETIPFLKHLRNKKLKKYFNRETMAAIAVLGNFLEETSVDPFTPFFYSTGLLEYEDYGLDEIVRGSIEYDCTFSEKLFIDTGLAFVSPLNQFKVLQNMPLSFLSINFGFQGDNAVVYSSASSLLVYAMNSVTNRPVLIGAGKTYSDGKVESGFAFVDKQEILDSKFLSYQGDAIDMFRSWSHVKR